MNDCQDYLNDFLDTVESVFCSFPSAKIEPLHFGRTLLAAAEGGRPDLVYKLLEWGADPNWTDECGFTPLMAACKADGLLSATLLLESGADVNAESQGNFTALLEAAQYGGIDLLRLLISRGARVKARSWFGDNVLLCALRTPDKEKVKLLLESGADFNWDFQFLRQLWLYIKFLWPSPFGESEKDVLRFLVERGLDLDLTLFDDWFPRERSTDMIFLLSLNSIHRKKAAVISCPNNPACS